MMEKSIEEMLREQRKMLEVQHMQHLAAILAELKRRFGDGVIEGVHKVQGDYNRWHWSNVAKEMGSNTIEDLIKALWEPMKKEGLEYTIERTEEGVQMKCTKYPSYDLAKQMGLTEWAYHFICVNDYYITEGFNPNIGFKRSKTLMEGDDCCDHFYYMK